MFKLESLVRPSSLKLAREAENRGMAIREMCLRPTWNQRCWSCGKHHGWACMCSGEERRLAYNEHVARVNGAGGGEMYPNSPFRIVASAGAEMSPVVTVSGDKCEKCHQRPKVEGRRVCSACRQAAYRERSK